MKLLLASVLAGGLGLSWLGGSAAPESVTPIAPEGACDVRVEPLGNGVCRIECDGPQGPAWAIVASDGPGDCRVLERGGADCTTCPWTPACGECPLAAPAASEATTVAAPILELVPPRAPGLACGPEACCEPAAACQPAISEPDDC